MFACRCEMETVIERCRPCSHSGVLASYAQECGRPPVMENRIVGGADATDGAWPWQVDIQVQLSATQSAVWRQSRPWAALRVGVSPGGA